MNFAFTRLLLQLLPLAVLLEKSHCRQLRGVGDAGLYNVSQDLPSLFIVAERAMSLVCVGWSASIRTPLFRTMGNVGS